MKHFSFFLLLFFLCLGCVKTEFEEIPEHLTDIGNLTIYSSDVTAQNDIRFTRIRVFEESEELAFGRISGIAVDESERVYISESTQGHAAIHVFDTDGSYLTSLGGYGDGPGEFRSIINPQINDENLYALDVRQMKINVYSLQTFSFKNTIQLDPGKWRHIEKLNGSSPYDFTVLDSYRILFSFLKSEGRLDLLYRYVMNNSGEIISGMIIEQVLAEHFAMPDNNGIIFSPFSANGLMAVSDNEYLYTIWTENILLKEYTINGEYRRAFYHPYTNKRINREEVGEYRAAVQNNAIPDYWPAVHSVVMDDMNNFWLSTIIDDINDYQWWVLNNEGEVISKFNWPKSSEIQVVQNESIFTLETESDSGIQKIVKYKFQLK